MGENVKTNIMFEEMKTLFLQFKKDWNEYQITTQEIAGSSQMINGIYYYHVSDEERERISTILKEHAALDLAGT